LNQLTEKSEPKWGLMTAQHLMEHLEMGFKIASNEIQNFETATPAEHLEKVREMIFNHQKMPQNHKHPLMKAEKLEDLTHPDFATAKQKLLIAFDNFENYFKENPEQQTKNAVFGMMGKFEWDLLNTKHLNHHFEQFNIL